MSKSMELTDEELRMLHAALEDFLDEPRGWESADTWQDGDWLGQSDRSAFEALKRRLDAEVGYPS